MLTQEQNDRLTQVGPGTPMGELMRRYWHPIAASAELDLDNPTKEIRLLGEDLVLFRTTKGVVGVIEPSCAHRKASLAYGVPEENGIRCAYHGWIFDENGQCVDQPSEPEGSKFKEKVRIKAYKAQEIAGVIWLYLGPTPAPLLPNYDMLVWPGVRTTWSVELPCNWLQCMENSMDPLHFQWLHRYWGGWQMNKLMPVEQRDSWNRQIGGRGADHKKIGFEVTDYGIIKRRLVGDETEESDHWKMGHPIFFPNILRIGQDLQCRVPVDDTHTLHFMLEWRALRSGEESTDYIPHEKFEPFDELGKIRRDYVIGQDQVAWIIQGSITDRTTERLGVGDIGVIMYRRLLEEQMRLVQEGEDPMNTYRDASQNEIIIAPCESFDYPGYEGIPRGPFTNIVVNNTVEATLSGEGEILEEFVEAEKIIDTPGQFSLLTPPLKNDIHAK